MAINKRAKNIYINVKNEYTCVCGELEIRSESINITATNGDLVLASNKKIVVNAEEGVKFGKYEAPLINNMEEENTEKGSITLKRAYWIDEEGKEREDLDIDFPVTLYIELVGDYEAGKKLTTTIEDVDEDGIKKATCTGTVNEDGILVIENFKLEQEQKEE